MTHHRYLNKSILIPFTEVLNKTLYKKIFFGLLVVVLLISSSPCQTFWLKDLGSVPMYSKVTGTNLHAEHHFQNVIWLWFQECNEERLN
jgi:hypothetical protein